VIGAVNPAAREDPFGGHEGVTGAAAAHEQAGLGAISTDEDQGGGVLGAAAGGIAVTLSGVFERVGPGVGHDRFVTGRARRGHALNGPGSGESGMAGEDAPVLELRGLSKTYDGGVRAVRDVSLSVGRGEVYGFLGPNGAGKSTAIRMLLGLIRPTAGEARLWGAPVSPDALRRVGSLVDGGTFYPFLSGRGNLEVLARTQGRQPDRRRIGELLEEVGLAPAGERRVNSYSTGMRQRLGVAAALLNDPDLVILDEPANGLDVDGLREMRTLIRGLARERGKTVFLSSHLLHEVEQLCDRVAVVRHGTVLQEARMDALLARGESVVIRAEPLEAARTALAGRWSVEANEDGRLVVRAPQADAPEMVERLVAAGARVFQVTAERRSLEQAFLSITHGEEPSHA
jgi:ABC-2 type transport system ATP-binding protein